MRKIRRGFIPIMTGCDLSRRRLPLLTAEASEPGPVVWLTGCAHGDEVGGTVVIHEVFRRLARTGVRKGAVRALPLMNPIGFEACSRHVTHSEEDLNRSFPGSADGSLAERIAAKIFRAILESQPAMVLDLHNDWTRTIPYTVLDTVRPDDSAAGEALERATDLASWCGFPRVMEQDAMRRTLSHTLLERGVSAMTIELGESRVVNEDNVALGVTAVWALLARIGVVEPWPESIPPERTIQPPLHYSNRPLCSTSGIIRFRCEPGEHVRAGQILARVEDAFGRSLESLRSITGALVLGVADSSVAYPGAPVVALGTPQSIGK